VSNVGVGPSLGAPSSLGKLTTSSTFSIATFLLNIVLNIGIEQSSQFTALKALVDDYIASTLQSKPLSTSSVFNDPAEAFEGLPDGNAVYGIHFHTSGPAAHDFTGYASSQKNCNTSRHAVFHLSNVRIQDLQVKTSEVLRMVWHPPNTPEAKPVTGIMGETFQGIRAVNKNGIFQSNEFVEAQLKLQKLRNADTEDHWVLYGNTSIPKEVLSWTTGTGTLEDLERAGLSYECDRDAMGNLNKGAVGLRLDGVDSVKLSRVAITGLKNIGVRSPMQEKCPQWSFKGADVRGISMTNVDLSTGTKFTSVL